MDLSRSYAFFQPETVKERIHIIGCGAGGSTVAELLCRLGLTKFSLYDFDVVECVNIQNQMYREPDIGRKKVDAMRDLLLSINPEAEPDIQIFEEGYIRQRLDGYVFLCVDNIDLRRKIATAQRGNQQIKAMFDFRNGMLDAQHFAADWSDPEAVEGFLSSMQFTHEEAEAEAETNQSACHMEKSSVVLTIRGGASVVVANFLNFVQKGRIEPMVLSWPIDFNIAVCS